MTEKEKSNGGYTVEGTVDICDDRELPNSDPAHGGNWSYEQSVPVLDGTDKYKGEG